MSLNFHVKKNLLQSLQEWLGYVIWLVFKSTCNAWPKLLNDLWAISCFEVLQSFRTRWKSLFPNTKATNSHKLDFLLEPFRMTVRTDRFNFTPANLDTMECANVGFKTQKKVSLVTLECFVENFVTFLLRNDGFKMKEVASSIEDMD